MDLLNFQSNTFRDGWQQVYNIVKKFEPRAKIAMTHDSHNSFGAGVKSNSKVAIDDVFHWEVVLQMCLCTIFILTSLLITGTEN
jgi:phosphodiesterase/alkaline phosphatase D-like protein